MSKGAEVLFDFEPGDKVTTKDGFTAPIAICGLTSEGIRYLMRGDYAEQWVSADDIETEAEPSEEKETMQQPPKDRAMKPREATKREPGNPAAPNAVKPAKEKPETRKP